MGEMPIPPMIRELNDLRAEIQSRKADTLVLIQQRDGYKVEMERLKQERDEWKKDSEMIRHEYDKNRAESIALLKERDSLKIGAIRVKEQLDSHCKCCMACHLGTCRVECGGCSDCRIKNAINIIEGV